jgi:tetratricopeptide (TPR) repeat protein
VDGAGGSGRAVASLHERAMHEAECGRYAVARRLLRAALRRDPEPVRRAHLLVSLAYHEAERSSLAAGLALLDAADAVPGLPARIRGLVASQRGLLRMRAGAVAPALADFDAALRLLDWADGEAEPQDVCRALLNRGILRLRPATVGQARADFARCVEIATRHGLDLLAAKASHNLGYLSMLAGDLPRALREMDAVPGLDRQSPAATAIYHADRAQVLLAAGLFGEADEDLCQAAQLFRAARVRQDEAAAELARAEVALRQERWRDARRLAGRARRRFAARGADTWALLAEAVAVAADVCAGRGLRATEGSARRVAADLAAAGLVDEAHRAALTAAAAVLGRRGGTRGYAGRAAAARTVAGVALALRRDDPIGTRLQARAVRAALSDAEGRPRRATAELRAAVVDLHRYQASFGSLDLQTAAAGHVQRLAAQGLARALAGGGPARVFAWAEHARALSTRLPPVVPPDDPHVARLLERLRHARVELRAQALGRAVDPALRARCAQLERQIRQRSWHLAGPGQVTAPASLGTVQDAVGAHDGTLVAHLLSGGELYALVATARRRALCHLGPAAPAVELHRRLRADLDALAATNLPEPMRDTVRAASRTALRRLDALLWGPVRPRLAEGPLLLASSAGLATVPWPLLPALRGRPVAVVASATAWLASRREPPAHPTVAVAAGPRVPRAEAEVRLVAAGWPAATVLVGADATAAAVAGAAAGADVLHVAAHGVHEPDNPLFSHLDLADGPLFGHELDRLPRLPSHVVLSACELGLARARACDETLGMTAALLRGGAGSVVAGVARIADAAAYRFGPAHHAGLRRGLAPAAALAAAVVAAGDPDPAPLVCFGAGW